MLRVQPHGPVNWLMGLGPGATALTGPSDTLSIAVKPLNLLSPYRFHPLRIVSCA